MLPCFLAKMSQIFQKVIVFFLKRGEEIEPWFWHIWITHWQRFFPITAYLLWFQSSSGRKGWSKLDQKCKLWSVYFSWKLESFIFFQNNVFVARILPLLRILTILDHIGEVRAQKPLKRAISWMLNWYTKLNNHKCHSDEAAYHDYVSSWECKPKTSWSQKFIFLAKYMQIFGLH